MNCRNNKSCRHSSATLVLLLLLCLSGISFAQESRIRLGVQTGVQSSLLRYTVVPYAGEFQSLIDEGAVSGLSFCLDLDQAWSVLVDVEWNTAQWMELRGEDPRVELEMEKRTTLALPLLLRYRTPIVGIPLYVACGAALTVVPDNKDRFRLSYTGFTERDGWQTSTARIDQKWGGLNAIAEAGVDVALGSSFSLLLSARYQQPLSGSVSSERLEAEFLSIWRLRAGLYVAL
jgi:hypothetical protein